MVGKIKLEPREFALTNLDKIFWPEDGYQKKDLIEYYVAVAPWLLKHLENRALVFTRYPNGVQEKGFFQKNAPSSLPDWFTTWIHKSSDADRDIRFVMVNEPVALAWLANQACLEIHPWLSRVQTPQSPDYIVFDLDPSSRNTFQEVTQVALSFRELFEHLELRTYIKTSGANGLHIYLPVPNRYTYEQVRIFALHIARIIARLWPSLTTVERAVVKRGHKIYLDTLQNAQGKTLCSAYSVRARPGAPVSAPLLWEEVAEASPDAFNIKTIISRLKKKGDLFAPVLEDQQPLEQAAARLGLNDQISPKS